MGGDEMNTEVIEAGVRDSDVVDDEEVYHEQVHYEQVDDERGDEPNWDGTNNQTRKANKGSMHMMEAALGGVNRKSGEGTSLEGKEGGNMKEQNDEEEHGGETKEPEGGEA
ncbi:hypothetical protein C922_03328 [Plasmodium inui San Antonio 1]|uniref:Uncharacterized protein n=1 Tax=Plasmodium inui San Antonio 1 TaxID=1237626 RepID=W7A4A6_9APIC|nr:hypothetical protein C922_03328 [Plasmodium inui San Antonio 1]EUD66133.1 hypothetical protein C922_03328 [Plasmodium inui San Antonio 1]